MGYYGRYDRFNNEGNCIVISSRGAAGYVSYQRSPFYAAALCYPFFSKDENVLNTRFLYFALKTQEKENIERLVSHGGVPALNKEDVLNIEIPVPPIEVQREIVRILDSFTELEARHQQYAYYRDQLLSKENLETLDGKPVEMVKVGDVFQTVTAPTKIKKTNYCTTGTIPIIDQGKELISGYTESVNALPRYPWVLFGDHTCSIKYFDGQFAQGADGLKILKANEKLIPKFGYYALKSLHFESTEYSRHWMKFKQIEIPVPSLATQQKVVDILDRFDALTTSLTDGLPAEIEARRRQYEYYRDRLLDFPRKSVGIE